MRQANGLWKAWITVGRTPVGTPNPAVSEVVARADPGEAVLELLWPEGR
jgi:hypothetical protein